MYSYKTNDTRVVKVGCLFLIIWLMLLGSLCTFMFEYCLWSLFQKDIPWYADLIAGLPCSPILVPLTITCWVLRLCGIEVPILLGH